MGVDAEVGDGVAFGEATGSFGAETKRRDATPLILGVGGGVGAGEDARLGVGVCALGIGIGAFWAGADFGAAGAGL